MAPSKVNQREPAYLFPPGGPPAWAQAEGALVCPAAGFGTTRDGSGIGETDQDPCTEQGPAAGRIRALQDESGLPGDGSGLRIMNQGPLDRVVPRETNQDLQDGSAGRLRAKGRIRASRTNHGLAG